MRDVVLVGGGHSHIQVLAAFAAAPLPRCRLTLVVDRPVALYSGMVPGYVAGHYRADELEIDPVALALHAGARVVLGRAVALEPTARQITVADGDAVHYDVAAFDIGSTVAGLDHPGVREHALPTRPISEFVRQVPALVARVARHDGREPFRILVVGGGAGGVELAFTLEHRLRARADRPVSVELLEHGPHILAGYAPSLRRRVERLADRRRIGIGCNRRVTAVDADVVRVSGADPVRYDGLVWVTGAVSHPIFRDSGIATDDRGFARVRSTLQFEAHDDVFGTGDCATLIDHPATAKAGVYAVRQGPIVAENLRAMLAGTPLRTYRPQRDFLALLNLGDGSALGTKWGFTVEGRWVMRLKDRIDRRFMKRFQAVRR